MYIPFDYKYINNHDTSNHASRLKKCLTIPSNSLSLIRSQWLESLTFCKETTPFSLTCTLSWADGKENGKIGGWQYLA